MKGPVICHDPTFQQELIRSGTREQIIEWLCWNDPNGTYTDHDSEIEGMMILTVQIARDIMRKQIEGE